MPKNVGKNLTGFAMQFLGGLVFLAVVWQLWGVASAPSLWGNGLNSGAFWATILYAVAVLSTISLLFTSFAQLGGMSGMAGWRAMKATTAAAFTLAILTASNQTWLTATVLGFLIASVGTASAMMKANWKGMK
jgi:hypothetical protein